MLGYQGSFSNLMSFGTGGESHCWTYVLKPSGGDLKSDIAK
jgi:hypothetical protein